ncbi:unnamed protein product [Brassica rapa]|uniref:Uncharacterized protein n=1 Tax=Brassica campestris TaxID=3711 RepID=A0A8D9MG64_BRACM|nr:unnamed protein product [Brassica rapa]
MGLSFLSVLVVCVTASSLSVLVVCLTASSLSLLMDALLRNSTALTSLLNEECGVMIANRLWLHPCFGFLLYMVKGLPEEKEFTHVNITHDQSSGVQVAVFTAAAASALGFAVYVLLNWFKDDDR